MSEPPSRPKQQGEVSIYPRDSGWSREEFAGIRLGDTRLETRFLSVSAD
jgi:hypothetical protein